MSEPPPRIELPPEAEPARDFIRGTQGVSLDVAEHLVVVFVFLDGKRVESTLVDMPVAHSVAMMLPVHGQ